MFSKLILLALVIACVFAAPSMDVIPLEKHQPTVIPIVSQSDELEANGTYHFSYETGNGIKREEIAYEKVIPKTQGRSADSNEGGESDESNEIHVQRGSYSYTAPDGTVYTVRYIADENGFQPVGDHLPRVPEIAHDSNSAEKSGRSLKSDDSAQSASAPKLYEAKAALAPKESSQSEEPTSSTPNTQTESVKTGEPIVSKESENLPVSTPESVPIVPQDAQTESTTGIALDEIKLTPSTESTSTEVASELKQSDLSTTSVPEKETKSIFSSTEGSGEQPSSTASINEQTSTATPDNEQPSTAASSSEQSTSEASEKSTSENELITTNNVAISTENVSSTTVST